MAKVSVVNTIHKLGTKSQRNARKIVEKFFKVTSIENKTTKKRWLAEKLFWMIVYLSGIVLTILTCIDLYKEYEDHPFSVKIEPILADSISPSDITVCLPFFNTERFINFWLSYEYSFEERTPWYAIPTETQPFSLAEKIQDIFTNMKSWQGAQEIAWEPPLLYVAQQYLAAIYEAEFLRAHDSEYTLTNMLSATDNTSQAIVNSLIPQMRKWNVTIREFRELFGQKFRKFFPMNVTLVSGTEINDAEPKDELSQDITFITKDQVCYKIRLSNTSLNVNISARIIVDKKNLRYYRDPKRFPYDEPFKDYMWMGPIKHFNGPVTVDFSGKQRAGSIEREHDEMFIAKFRRYTIFSMTPGMKYVYEPGVPRRKVCSVDETSEVCQAKRRRKIIQKLCNCNTVSAEREFELIDKGLCAFEKYEHCLLNYTSAQNEDSACMNECLLEWCTSWQFNISKSDYRLIAMVSFWGTFSGNDGFGLDLAVIEISILKSDYLLFSEFSPFTIENIIGIIGGAFGFWLGLDMFIIFYTTLTVPALLLLNKTVRKESNDAKIKSDPSRVTERGLLNDNYWSINTAMNEINLQFRQFVGFAEFIRWIVQKLTWFSLFFIGAGLTVKLYVQLYLDYKSGATQSIATVIINEPTSLPPSAFCIPIEIIDIKLFLDQAETLICPNDMPYFLNGTDFNLTTLLASNETWPPLLTFLSFSYFDGLFAISQGTYSDIPGRSPEIANFLLNATRGLLEKYSLTNTILFNRFAHEFVRLRNVTANCYRSSENKSIPMLATQVTLEGVPREFSFSTSLCLHFPLETFEFHDENDRCFISLSSIENDLAHARPVYWTLKSPASFAYRGDATIRDAQSLDIVFSYISIYEFKSNCNPEAHPGDCLAKCRSENTSKISFNCTKLWNISEDCHPPPGDCQCMPSRPPDFEYCLNSEFLRIEAACRNECKTPACTQYMHKLDTVNIGNTEDSSRELNIRIRNFIYPVMSETLMMTSGDFLAASGGLLGFYLGLDATFLVSLVITPLLFLYSLWLKNSPSGALSNKQITPARSTPSLGGYFYINYFVNAFGVDSKSASKSSLDKLFERLIWSAIYLLFGVVTFIMCVDFYHQYRENPIGSNFSTSREKELKINLTLCAPLTPSELAELPYNETALCEQDYLFLRNNPFTRQQINDSNKWNTILLRIAHRYLIIVEEYKIMEKVDMAKIWKSLNNAKHYATSTMELLGSQLERHNITQHQLLQKFGQELQRSRWINIIKRTKPKIGAPVDRKILINQTSFVSEFKICYSLTTGAISFSSGQDYVTFEIDKSRLQDVSCFNSSIDQEITFDLLGSEAGTLYSGFKLNLSLGQMNTIDIIVGDMIKMLPKAYGVSRCSETITQVECMGECRRVAIEQQCNCSLFDARMEQPSPNSNFNRDGCTWTKYKNCLPHFSTQSASKCIRGCLIPCERIRYEIAVGSNVAHQKKYRGSYIIGTSTFLYQIYSERLVWTFYSFVAQLGGILGLFLGIDLVLLIEWLFSIVRWMAGRVPQTAGPLVKKPLRNKARNIKIKTLAYSER